MAIYYKLKLHYVDAIKNLKINKKIAYGNRYIMCTDLKELKHIDENDFEKLEKYLRSIKRDDVCINIENLQVEKILQKNILENLSLSFSSSSYTEVIGEIIYDKDNNMYLKELVTGFIFPIIKLKNIENFIQIKKRNVSEHFNQEYFLSIERNIHFSSLLKLNFVGINEEVANQNEIDERIKFFTGIFSKGKKKVLYEHLKKLSQENVFKEGIEFLDKPKEEPKQEIIRERQSQVTKRMESIEYLLSVLSVKDENIYLEYKNKYEELLKTPSLTLDSLCFIEGDIEYYLLFGTKEAVNIIENLTEMRQEYLFNFLTNSDNKTGLDLKKINKINDLFLKVKDKYDHLSQRKVLKSLSFLYLLEVYENKDFISVDELKNSYFVDNLKTIVICIRALQELDLITCDYFIELYDELTCENVFDMIRNISFKRYSNQDVKKLLLTI